MAYCRRAGDVPPTRHARHRGPDGELYTEELTGEEGFSSDSSPLREVSPLYRNAVDDERVHVESGSVESGSVESGGRQVDELAVTVDTSRMLELGEGAAAGEDPAFAWNWSGRGPGR
jgi:hypothetical protein